MKEITRKELRRILDAQGVPWQHQAFVCPRCGVVQSIESLMRTHQFKSTSDANEEIGFTCVGRFLDVNPEGDPRGCHCTFGIPVGAPDPPILLVDAGQPTAPCFAPATPVQALQLMQSWSRK